MSVRASLPGFVTHYYLPGRRPFLSLSELGDAELGPVLAGLRTLRRDGRQHRPFGPRYMNLRRRTEARLRELFEAAGGRPERLAPHYFVLGRSSWYEGLAENMQHVRLPLSALPSGQTSITYPDSFTALAGEPSPSAVAGEPSPSAVGGEPSLSAVGGEPLRGPGQQQPRPYHGRVFLLGELPGLVDRFGVPDPRWDGQYQAWPAAGRQCDAGRGRARRSPRLRRWTLMPGLILPTM